MFNFSTRLPQTTELVDGLICFKGSLSKSVPDPYDQIDTLRRWFDNVDVSFEGIIEEGLEEYLEKALCRLKKIGEVSCLI